MREALQKIAKKRKKLKKRTKSLYSKLSQEYKKFDWRCDYIETRELSKFSNNSALGVKRKARELKKIRVCKKDGRKAYYSKTNIKGIFLLQELMCQMDDDYWFDRPTPPIPTKPKYVPYYFDSKYLGRCYICSHPQTLEWKQPLLTEFLQDKQYIFDEDNPFGRPFKEVKRFIEKTLIKGKVEKWNYYFQRFLSECTK